MTTHRNDIAVRCHGRKPAQRYRWVTKEAFWWPTIRYPGAEEWVGSEALGADSTPEEISDLIGKAELRFTARCEQCKDGVDMSSIGAQLALNKLAGQSKTTVTIEELRHAYYSVPEQLRG
jgi:hypothetical protein